MPESVSILIPTHNRCDILLRALESLHALQIPPQTTVELIVIANGCTDRTHAAVEGITAQMPFPTRVLDEPELGLNRARNRGLGAAHGSIVAFLDDDVWVEPGWLAGLLEIFATRPADLVAGVVNLWWEAVPRPDWMTTRSEHLLSCVNYGDHVLELTRPGQAVGANLAFRRTVLERVGLFNAAMDRAGDYPLGGGDTDFVTRALLDGRRMFYAPQAVVRHWVAPQRITRKYLGSIAYGNALGRAFLGPPPRSSLAARWAFTRYFTLACVYGVLQYAATLMGRKKQAIHLQIRRMACRGLYIGTFRRFYGRAPAKAPHAAAPLVVPPEVVPSSASSVAPGSPVPLPEKP